MKVQIIGILQEIDSFYWPKMHLWKGAKKFGRGPPLLIWGPTLAAGAPRGRIAVPLEVPCAAPLEVPGEKL